MSRIRRLVGTGVVAMLTIAGASAYAQPAQRPNIVIILADDVGLMNFGAYGGEARTPNIDRLAARGAVFTNYRASPLCSPSRAMLLTGMDNHLTGVATIPEVLPAEQNGKRGYSMALEPGVLTLADRLRRVGYRTLMIGKWHLGEKGNEMPQAHGFDRSFALAASGADNWADRSYLPYYKDAPWFENGVEASVPKDFYSSRFIVDRMIAYLDATDATKPFFAYLPFQANHIPVQAPRRFIDHYAGRYDAGWEALRAVRHRRAQELGLIPAGAPMAALPPGYRRWRSLSGEDRALYAARMEVHAAMLEAMDYHIGRFMRHLATKRQLENTIFVITSDNGPEPSRGDDSLIIRTWHAVSGYSIGLKGMGGPRSWGFIGPEWAAATATPGAWFKFYATEGGIRVPLIVAGPGIGPRRIDGAAMVADIAPTLIERVGVPLNDRRGKPMTGRTLQPLLNGRSDRVYAPDDIRVIEVSGNTAVYKGAYKITRSVPPVGDGRWRLFDLSSDPGETTDLSASKPAVLRTMLADYRGYAQRVGVLEMPEGYDSRQQVVVNTTKRLLTNWPWLYAVAGGLVFALLAIAYRLYRLFYTTVASGGQQATRPANEFGR